MYFFLNFMLSKEVRHYCGVDISNAITEEEWENGRIGGWEIWERKMTVLTDFPYHACQAVTWANEMAMEDKRDMKNPFEWSRVMINFPGTPTYNCC